MPRASDASVPRTLDSEAELAIAYEPIWAIGTGKTPSVAEIAEMHRAIRNKLRERYGKPVGFSDHSLGPFAAFAAVALGAEIVEKHFTLSKEMYGPDASLALEPHELEELVDGIREISEILAAPVDKDAEAVALADMKEIFEKSVVSSREIPAGAVISREMVAAKKPGTGIPARRLDEIVGLRARRNIAADTVLTDADVE